MTNWGKKEHHWENATTVLLTSGILCAILYECYHWSWTLHLILILLVVTFVVHAIARICHLVEKWQYKRRRG